MALLFDHLSVFSIDPNITTATPVLDYNPTPSPNSVTFSAGNTLQCITLDIVSDTIEEPDEHFLIQATSGGDQILIADSDSDVIIVDDDCMFLFVCLF